MSSNPFDFQRAVEALREEKPTSEMQARARGALVKPNRAIPRLRYWAFGGVALALGVMMWPRVETSAGWAQVAQANQGQVRVHVVVRFLKSKHMFSEKWQDGSKYSLVLSDPLTGELVFWSRSDGDRSVRYSHYSLAHSAKNGVPQRAHLSRVSPVPGYQLPPISMLGMDSPDIEKVIAQDEWKLVDQKPSVKTEDGTFDLYRLKNEMFKTKRMVNAYVEKDTKLIRRLDSLGEKGEVVAVSKVDYPKSIDPKRFSLTPPPGVKVLDVEKEISSLNSVIAKGLGTKSAAGKTITLRAVLHDTGGSLWVLWTGGAPAGSLENPVLVKGYGKRRVFGLKAFTVAKETSPPTYPAPGCGERLGGMAVELPVGKLNRVTLTIPVLDETGKKKLGSVTFADVPVRPIDSLYDLGESLGLHKPGLR